MNTTPHSQDARVHAATADGFSEFRTIRHHRWRLLVRPELDIGQTAALASPYGRARTESRQWRRIKSAPWTAVFLTNLKYRGRNRKVYVKYELQRSFLDACKYLWRKTRSHKAMAAALMLRNQGFNAPEPWALLEKGFGPFRTKNALATAAVENSLALEQKMRRLVNPDTAAGLQPKRALIREFARLVGRLHSRGIIHGDLGPSNVLVQETDREMKLWLIDNERTRQYAKGPPPHMVVKNLVQINMFRAGVSNTDRIRFLAAYGRQRNLTKEDRRRLAREVRAGNERRMINRKRRRRGRQYQRVPPPGSMQD